MSSARGLTLKGINKWFGANHVLKDINIEIEPGEFLVLLGPSGCGKTTALRIVAGLEAADSGQVLLGDTDISQMLPKYRDVAMVFQSYALYPHKTVAGNIGFPLKVRGVSPQARDQAVREAASQVHMEDLLDRYPRQLSGGQRQRVALARAIIRRPSVFLMDEPLSNLDAKLRAHMRAELAQHIDHALLGTTGVAMNQEPATLAVPDREARLAVAMGRAAGHPANRHASCSLRRTGQSLCRRIHGLAADEFSHGSRRKWAFREPLYQHADNGRGHRLRRGIGISS